jgi:hypothetical protein
MWKSLAKLLIEFAATWGIGKLEPKPTPVEEREPVKYGKRDR